MPKKNWTDEERKAFAEKMKASRNKEETVDKVELTQEQFQALMERLSKLESTSKESTPGRENVQLNDLGRAVGIMQKYSVDARDYDDPRPLLMDLPELQRFAFKENYFLNWDVEQLMYETKFGTSYSVPKFILKLYKRLYEDDGTPTPDIDRATGVQRVDDQGKPMFRSYLVQRFTTTTDPNAAVSEARRMGLSIENANTREFLDQMRFLEYKNWLLEVFQPKKPSTARRTENMVVGSTQVQVESYSELV
jgi:hypothetical protein